MQESTLGVCTPRPQRSALPTGLETAGLRIRDDLALRGHAGLWAHLVGVIFLMLLAWNDPERWAFRTPGAVVLTLLTVLRGIWIVWGRGWTSSLQTWLRLYSPLLTATGLSWSLLWGVELLWLGWHPWQTGVEMVIIIAIALGGVIVVAPVLRCGTVYQAAIWLPVATCSLLVGSHLYFVAALAVICFAYATISASRYHREYHTTLSRELDLVEARRQAEIASDTKSAFVANISHELRTPLHGILGMLDLSLQGPLPAGQREMVETARNSADSLLALVNDILDFSKVEAGRMVIERIPYSPVALAHEVVQLLAVRARQKGITLELDAAPHIPPFLWGDPTRLRQILINLAGNAVKFTAHGSVTIQLTLTHEHKLLIAVRDTGIGIPADKHAIIFEAFAQADNATTRQFGGTGLGLALSQRLARLLQSEIRLESAPGLGSTFSFELPAEAAPHAESPLPAPVPTASLPALDILLVEDNLVNQRVARGILEADGHRVTVAANGLAAVHLVTTARFDVILMDLQMPVMGGDDATRRIREAGVRTPIVGLSANADPADRQRCLDLGMNAYLTKPFRRTELFEVLAQLKPTPTGQAA